MVILAFGDMFHILIRIDETACPVNPDPNNDENPFCKTGLSYLDVYAQILGNFDYGSFLGHPTTIILFIVMTLFGTIIYLNILIAVVSDSYSKSCEKSSRLFGKARILTVANISALEHIMQPTWLNSKDKLLVRISKLLFKLLSICGYAYGVFWIVYFISLLNEGTGSTAGKYISTSVMVYFFVGSIFLFSFVFTGWGEERRFMKMTWINDNALVTWFFWKPIAFIVYLVMGQVAITTPESDSNKGHDE
uniref:Ion transport domain-containing protein n=2 Tax=Ditylum brightwellii TaxID=49249 RepID=A0A6V2F1Y5_9STRA